MAPLDPYTKAAYADLLLRQNRNQEVVRLLEADQNQDNLLLRLSIAGKRLHLIQADEWAAIYQARYEAARRDGDFTHLREQALFLLEVRHDPVAALPLAERNWQLQREPADIRLLVAAAGAAHDRDASSRALEWLRQTRYEDQALHSRRLTPGGPLRMSWRRLIFSAAPAHAWATPSLAHKPSDSYLTVNSSGGERVLSAQWDIALRDLEHAVGLDQDGDGHITWGELKASRAAVER